MNEHAPATKTADATITQPPEGVASRLSRWQVGSILIVVPALYLANSFTPWTMGLFTDLQHRFFISFWLSICVLHWISVAMVVVFIRRAGGTLSEIGFSWGTRGTLLFVGLILSVGLALIGWRAAWPTSEPPSEGWLVYPATIGERVCWVFIALTAGFCEELVYRGFGIRILQGRGWHTWEAVTLASVAFAFIHGMAALVMFPLFFITGLIFSGIFLWRKNLTAAMYLHALYVMAVLAV